MKPPESELDLRDTITQPQLTPSLKMLQTGQAS